MNKAFVTPRGQASHPGQPLAERFQARSSVLMCIGEELPCWWLDALTGSMVLDLLCGSEGFLATPVPPS